MAIVKLNFSGHKNEALAELGYVDISLHVDLADPTLKDRLAELIAAHVDSGDIVYLVPPGLAAYYGLVLSSLNGINGNFPFQTAMLRQADGGFIPLEPVDLQAHRNEVARKQHRNGTVVF